MASSLLKVLFISLAVLNGTSEQKAVLGVIISNVTLPGMLKVIPPQVVSSK